MEDEITAQQIKDIRLKYGLSQQAFARVLGLGEASIVRYENGQKPTRANANLIRAAAIPEFMADCLERAGDTLSTEQREQAERIVYADVTLKEDGAMDINEMYLLTLKQEILNEKAANIMGELFRARSDAKKAGDDGLAMMYEDMIDQLALLKPTIIYEENTNEKSLSEIDGKLDLLRSLHGYALRRAA